MNIAANNLCRVLGSFEVGRVLALEVQPDWHDQPVEMVHVELTNATVWVTRGEITQCWSAETGSGMRCELPPTSKSCTDTRGRAAWSDERRLRGVRE